MFLNAENNAKYPETMQSERQQYQYTSIILSASAHLTELLHVLKKKITESTRHVSSVMPHHSGVLRFSFTETIVFVITRPTGASSQCFMH